MHVLAPPFCPTTIQPYPPSRVLPCQRPCSFHVCAHFNSNSVAWSLSSPVDEERGRGQRRHWPARPSLSRRPHHGLEQDTCWRGSCFGSGINPDRLRINNVIRGRRRIRNALEDREMSFSRLAFLSARDDSADQRHGRQHQTHVAGYRLWRCRKLLLSLREVGQPSLSGGLRP